MILTKCPTTEELNQLDTIEGLTWASGNKPSKYNFTRPIEYLALAMNPETNNFCLYHTDRVTTNDVITSFGAFIDLCRGFVR